MSDYASCSIKECSLYKIYKKRIFSNSNNLERDFEKSYNWNICKNCTKNVLKMFVNIKSPTYNLKKCGHKLFESQKE